MNQQHLHILRTIADLVGRASGTGEAEEFRVGRASGLVPRTVLRHAYVNSPYRARVLHALTGLEAAKLIYVTKNGYWRIRLTRLGHERVAAPEPALLAPITPLRPPERETEPGVWEAPRPATVPFAPRESRLFSSVALTVTTLGVVLVFALTNLPHSALARRDAATPVPVSAAAPPLVALPIAIAPTAAPAPPPSAPPTPTVGTQRVFVVANTGGEGVYLRRSPRLADRLAAWPERTRLVEIGPETTADGVTWRHVRAPDGSAGFVPAQYTAATTP